MTSEARTAYHECIDRVELHQVTLSAKDQFEFIRELRGQLVHKQTALRAEIRRSRSTSLSKP